MKPSCPKCGEHEFEVVLITPKNAAGKWEFIQCSNCGVVVGTESLEVHEKINKIMEILKLEF